MMRAVNGYYENGVCIPTETLVLENNQKVIITILDEKPPVAQDSSVSMKLFGTISHEEAESDVQQKLEAMKGFFGSLSHEEAELIRNNRVNFRERL